MPAEISPRDAFGRALVEAAAADPSIVVLCGDLNDSVKVGNFAAAYPQRFIQAGIAEQNMVSMAAGLATTGKVPFAVTFAAILCTRSLDQANISVAYSNLNVKLVGAYLGLISGKTGATHQAINDIAIMRSLPHMTVISPADAEETAAAVRAIARFVGPVYLRVERDPVPALPRHQTPFQIGRGLTLREGNDVTLVGAGAGASWACQAAELLAGRGVAARVLDIHTIKPLDEALILQAAGETAGIVTVENHSIIGGLGGAVAELLAESRPTPLLRIGVRDTYGESGANEDLLRKYHMAPEDIAAAAERLLARSGK